MNPTNEDRYLDLLRRIMLQGEDSLDRTGTGTRRIFGAELRLDLEHGFPLLTTKKINWRKCAAEFVWMVHGGRNVKELHEMDCHIWDRWADENGDLGPVYGAQWRRCPTDLPEMYGIDKYIDQLAKAVKLIHRAPWDRRIIVSAWNVAYLDEMRLPPCHMLFQFFCGTDNSLSTRIDMRSVDMFLGMPFDIVLYGFLTEFIAALTGRWAKQLIFHTGDTHIYKNHFEAVEEQLKRYPYTPPAFSWRSAPGAVDICMPERALDAIKLEDFEILGYSSWPAIKGDISI
jgi:thymidylate synthase